MHGEERKLETEALHTQWLKNAVAFVSMLRRNAKCDVGRLMVRVEKEEVSQLAPTLWFDRRQLFFSRKAKKNRKSRKRALRRACSDQDYVIQPFHQCEISLPCAVQADHIPSLAHLAFRDITSCYCVSVLLIQVGSDERQEHGH